jgi:predicted esterase
MKNTIVFLHGKGKKPTDCQYQIFSKIAEYYNADLIPITAPNIHKEGFRWHNGNKQSENEAKAEFEKSVKHIETELRNILFSRKIKYSDIIWLGHSQGGDMAIRQALKYGARKVIVFASDISGKFPLSEKINTSFTIDWIESGNDSVLSEDRRASYKKLLLISVTVNYIFSPNSTHDILDLEPYFASTAY